MKYTDYVEAETTAGREPLPMNQWRAERMHASQKERTAQAEKGFDTGPGPLADTEQVLPAEGFDAAPEPSVAELEDYNQRIKLGATPPAAPSSSMQSPIDLTSHAGALVFQCRANRWRIEIMQSGHKALVGGSVVTIPHRQIEFNDWHWTADLENPDHREKAEWLVHSEAWRRGEIRLVNQAAPQRELVHVTTGPRTSSTARIQKIDRPAGQLSARLE